MARYRCTCGKQFSSLGAFEKHRVGDYEKRTLTRQIVPSTRRCLSTEEMVDKGFREVSGKWTFGEPMPEHLRGRRTAATLLPVL